MTHNINTNTGAGDAQASLSLRKTTRPGSQIIGVHNPNQTSNPTPILKKSSFTIRH